MAEFDVWSEGSILNFGSRFSQLPAIALEIRSLRTLKNLERA